MSRTLLTIALASVLVAAVPLSLHAAASTTPQDLQALIQELRDKITAFEAQIAELTKQVTAVQVELKFERVLQRGVQGDDVRQLQEFLKTFPDVYPEGLVTGYFGPLTESAVRRFQELHNIEPIGIVGPKTQEQLQKLLSEGAGSSGVIPKGLLTAPGLNRENGSTTSVPFFPGTSTSTNPGITPGATSSSPAPSPPPPGSGTTSPPPSASGTTPPPPSSSMSPPSASTSPPPSMSTSTTTSSPPPPPPPSTTATSSPTQAVTLVAPVTSSFSMGWSFTSQNIRDNTIGQSINFGYPSDKILDVAKFRLYQKGPQDSSYSVVAEFTGVTSSPCIRWTFTSEWIAAVNNCVYSPTNIGISRIKAGSSYPYTRESESIPVSSYAVGDYNYYLVAVGADGREGPPSPTAKFVFLQPSVITAPTASQSSVSLQPTFQWTKGSDWPSSLPDWPSGLPINVMVFDDVTVSTAFWSSGAVYGNSQVYYGPALTPGKKYYVSVFAEVNDNKNYVSHVVLPNAVSEFWVTTATTTSSVAARSEFASLLHSLTEVIQKIQALLFQLR